tara:strand:+ start:6206 stop:6679 length:474 start_codon:yes stop_codon:yes gene_type:complete
MFGIGEVAAIGAVISTLKSLNDALSTIKETGGHASDMANIIGKYSDVEQKIQEVETAKGGILDVKQSMQLQIAKRQAESFNRALKDSLLMSGQGSQYTEIMTRVEESKERHKKAIGDLKRAKAKRNKMLKELLTYFGAVLIAFGVCMAGLFLFLWSQ